MATVIDINEQSEKELHEALYLGLVPAEHNRRSLEKLLLRHLGGNGPQIFALRLFLRTLGAKQLAKLRVLCEPIE